MDLVGLYAFGFGLFTIGFGLFNNRLWLLLLDPLGLQSWDLQLEIQRIPANIHAGDMVANAESIVSYSQQS
jgi:hypothetical protein